MGATGTKFEGSGLGHYNRLAMKQRRNRRTPQIKRASAEPAGAENMGPGNRTPLVPEKGDARARQDYRQERYRYKHSRILTELIHGRLVTHAQGSGLRSLRTRPAVKGFRDRFT